MEEKVKDCRSPSINPYLPAHLVQWSDAGEDRFDLSFSDSGAGPFRSGFHRVLLEIANLVRQSGQYLHGSDVLDNSLGNGTSSAYWRLNFRQPESPSPAFFLSRPLNNVELKTAATDLSCSGFAPAKDSELTLTLS